MAAKEQRKRTEPSVHLMRSIESAQELGGFPIFSANNDDDTGVFKVLVGHLHRVTR